MQESGGTLTRSGLEGGEVPLAQVAAHVGVAVIEVAVAFAAVLHAQLVSVAHAAADTISGHSLSHQRIGSTIDVSFGPHAQTGPPPPPPHTPGGPCILPLTSIQLATQQLKKRRNCMRGTC